MLLIDLDAANCYIDDAAYYKVEPDFIEIRKAIINELSKKTNKGMDADEVFSIIKSFKNTYIVRDDQYEDQARFVEIEVRTCFCFQNNIRLHFSLKNNKLDSDFFTIDT